MYKSVSGKVSRPPYQSGMRDAYLRDKKWSWQVKGITDFTLILLIPQSGCQNGTYVLGFYPLPNSGLISFLWSTGSTASSITVKTSGIYTCVVTYNDQYTYFTRQYTFNVDLADTPLAAANCCFADNIYKSLKFLKKGLKEESEKEIRTAKWMEMATNMLNGYSTNIRFLVTGGAYLPVVLPDTTFAYTFATELVVNKAGNLCTVDGYTVWVNSEPNIIQFNPPFTGITINAAGQVYQNDVLIGTLTLAIIETPSFLTVLKKGYFATNTNTGGIDYGTAGIRIPYFIAPFLLLRVFEIVTFATTANCLSATTINKVYEKVTAICGCADCLTPCKIEDDTVCLSSGRSYDLNPLVIGGGITPTKYKLINGTIDINEHVLTLLK